MPDTSHKIVKCREHDLVIYQCRCSAVNKPVQYITCPSKEAHEKMAKVTKTDLEKQNEKLQRKLEFVDELEVALARQVPDVFDSPRTRHFICNRIAGILQNNPEMVLKLVASE